MRIITWNCQAGFVNKNKAAEIFAKDPDIAIIQECSKRDAKEIQHEGYSPLWFGNIPTKGLAIFCKSQWKLRPLAQPDHNVIVPIAVEGPENFTLVAVWACAVKGNMRESYVGLIHHALAAHPEWFNRGPVFMAGDFNSNSQFDKHRPVSNHSSLVAQLQAHGMISTYHFHHKEEQGKESRPTFYLYRKSDTRLHLDYIFMPSAWTARLNNFEVGDFSQWSSLSDHCPLTIDVASS
jgi:exodeoxyribonuclease III